MSSALPQDLHSLLRAAGLSVSSSRPNPLVSKVTFDSRSAEAGSLFVGLPGENVDGGIFWSQAFLLGSVAAIISSKSAKLNPPGAQDAVFVVPDPVEHWAGELAAVFWQRPSSKMTLIGVTGTNGKTTTTYLIEYLSSVVGKPTALFGTLVNRWPHHSSVSEHTTPFADSLQAQLASALKAGSEIGVMEVSSHSLVQQRVAGCRFSGAVFTNLTQDHLDYHSSMDEYFEAKALLFDEPLLASAGEIAVVNIDDPWGERLAERLGERCWRSSMVDGMFDSARAELTIADLEMTPNGFKGLLRSPVGEGEFMSPLIGKFNLMNLLQAVGVLTQQGFPLPKLLERISDFPGVPGRMERITVEDACRLPTVLVDYAHTPDGLKNALIASRPLVKGALICVFGCGGDRDRGKRSKMGLVAAQFADRLILTSDNPRMEDPAQILNDVLVGIPPNVEMIVEPDRSSAIKIAIEEAYLGDVVLIAGKGHEDYQILGTKKVHFDDREEALRRLKAKSLL